MSANEFLKKPYLEKDPDEYQLKVATSLENTIVAAGAGSGKTQTLATRFAYLVMSDPKNTVDKILTLTFTEKAAAEMYRRIYLTLKKFSQDLPDCPEKTRAQNAVENFSRAHIQTLDSFSMEIVKQAANLYGIRPDFSVGSADTESVIKDLAFNFIMENRASKAIQWISEAGRFQNATKYFCEAATRHTSLADSLLQNCSVFKESLKKQAQEISALTCKPEFFGNLLGGISDLALALNELKPRANEAASIKQLRNEIDVWKNSGALIEKIKSTPIPSVFSDGQNAVAWVQSEDFQSFINLVMRLDIEIKSTAAAAQIIIEIHKTLFGENGIAQIFLRVIDFIANYEYLKEFYSLLDEFVEEVNKHKRKSGSLTFMDSQKLALRILYDQGQIRQELRDNFTKIMIDEFQDNNGANRDLLLLISRQNENGERLEPDNAKSILDITGEIMQNRLFFVGDEKQSIYKFRGADVAVFNGLKKLINAKTLNMSNNYRSDELLLQEFNKLFGAIDQPASCKEYSVFPSERNDAQKDFEATFSKDAAAKFPEAKAEFLKKNLPTFIDNSAHRMHVCMINSSALNGVGNKSDFLSNKEARIYFIGQKIKEVIANTENISFKDFAILAKSRTDYAQFARVFSLMHIPYSLDQEANIFAEAPVNDIYNALRLCVYPSDMSCYCAFLCSPFCGLDLIQAETILALTKSAEESETRIAFDENSEEEIKTYLESKDGISKSGGYEKYSSAKKFFQKIQDEILKKPIAESITSLWYEYGYRYAPLWTKTNEYKGDGVERTWKQTENPMEEQYDLLFELARAADNQNKDVSWFIDQLADLRGATRNSESGELNAKEVDYQTEAKDAVKIMTIHKSKGLEFPYVFVYGCANQNKGNPQFENIIFSTQAGPVVMYNSLKENYFASSAIAAEEDKEKAEYKRLVYVAITRAINHVYIVGEWKEPDDQLKLKETLTSDLLLNIINHYRFNAENFSPFEFIDIPQVAKTEFNSAMNANPISVEDYNKKLSKQAALYDSFKEGGIVTTPQVPYQRTSPSSLEEKESVKNSDDEETLASNAYPEINFFVNKNALQKKDYGTLFHSFMEAWSKDARVFLDNISNYRFDESLVQKLSETNKKILLETFCKILATFLTPNGNLKNAALDALQNNREYHAEYKFKTKINSYIVKGTIDAVFQNADGTYTVLDYKTDLTPSPQFYYNQLGCYQKVAADLFTDGDASKVRCVLFYAETGEFIDVTDNARAAFNALTDEKIKELTLKNKETE